METVMTASNPVDRHQLVVVTGASTGMGAATARELASMGYHVLAGVRRDVDADALRADGIEPHILDITDESDVAAIAGRATDDSLRRPLRALINNAGIAVNAPVETLPIAEWRNLFEVNLFGHIAMTQALLPALLHSSGTVVNISSVGGKFAMATYGAYAGSKFALEAASDSLRREVAPFGVKVVVVEPGAVKTKMAEHAVAGADRLNANMTTDQLNRYADLTACHLGTTTLLYQGWRPCRTGRESDRQGSNRIEPTYPLHHRIRSGAPVVDPRGLRPIPRPHAAASPSAALRHELATASSSHRT
jgi:NAD(P)-dependent dehydrogenase (short-subunit alcohol dehydrogenase family)